MNVAGVARLVRGALGRDPVRRYESRYALVDGLARRAGFQLYNKNLAWQGDHAFFGAWSQFPEHRPEVKDRKYVLWSLALSTSELPGDTVECGVFDGGSSFLICLTREAVHGWHGRHHLFDSFAGLSEPIGDDHPIDDHTFRWRKHDLSVDEDRVLRNLDRFPFVDSHAGWIPTRFADVADRQFSFVHVDVDLYEPTLDSIRFFYPRLVPGGVLLCDDYGSTACPGAKKAFDEFIEDKPERHVVHLTTGQGLIVKR